MDDCSYPKLLFYGLHQQALKNDCNAMKLLTE